MQRLAQAPGKSRPATSPWLRLARLGILLLPFTLLAISSLRATGEHQRLLTLGALFQALAFLLALVTGGRFHQPITPAVVMLYVIALSWLLLGAPQFND